MVWDDWPPSTSPLLTEFPSRENPVWTLSGRRAEVRGAGHSGVGEIQVRPWRVVRSVRLEVNGAAPVTVSLKVAPDEVVRVLQAGEVQLTERITTALDHPLIFWSIVADGPVTIRLCWITDLADGDSEGTPLIPLIAEDQSHSDSHIRVGREALAPRFQVQPVSGMAGITSSIGDSLGFEVRGDRILRVILAAGADDGELDRAVDALRRRKLRAFRQDRILHTRRLEDRLVALVSPDPALDRAFGWAKVRLDGMLEGRPQLGRYVPHDPVRVARAMLAIGDRDLARDVIRSLRAGDSGGEGCYPEQSEGSLILKTGIPRSARNDSLPHLIDAYLRWSGEMLPDPASAGEPAAAADIELTASLDPAALVLAVIEGLWGLKPDAIRGELQISPALPPGWQDMTLQRVRIGATTLDLRVRRRPEHVVVAVRRSAGPPLKLRIGLRDRVAGGVVTLDDIELGGQEVAFTTEESHQVAFYDE